MGELSAVDSEGFVPEVGQTVWRIRWMNSTGHDWYYGVEQAGTVLLVPRCDTDPSGWVAVVAWGGEPGRDVRVENSWLFSPEALRSQVRESPWCVSVKANCRRVEAQDGTEICVAMGRHGGADAWYSLWRAGDGRWHYNESRGTTWGHEPTDEEVLADHDAWSRRRVDLRAWIESGRSRDLFLRVREKSRREAELER